MPTVNGCDAGQCDSCGKYTRRTVGRWCYTCYLIVVGLDRTEIRYTDPGRERRIALYRARADMNKPLFED